MKKGTNVRVTSGVDQGAEGTVFWSGKSKYGDGLRVGIKTGGGETLWLDDSQVEEIVPGSSASPPQPVPKAVPQTPLSQKKRPAELSHKEIVERFAQPLRSQCQIDRILVEESSGDTRSFAIDLQAGSSPGDPYFGIYTERPSLAALFSMESQLHDVLVERVSLRSTDMGNRGLEKLLKCNWMQGVKQLDLSDNRLTEKAVDLLSGHPLLQGLELLALGYDKLGDALGLLESPSLTHLTLSYCDISAQGLACLLSGGLKALRNLTLDASSTHETLNKLIMAQKYSSDHDIGFYSPEHWREFLSSEGARKLKSLSLNNFAFDADQAQEVANTPLPELEELNILFPWWDLAAAQAMFSGDGFPSLKRFAVSEMRLGDKTAQALETLGKANFAQQLSSLTINQSPIKSLTLKNMGLSSMQQLTELDLCQCEIDSSCCKAIARLNKLTKLRLAYNRINKSGVEQLLGSSMAGQLTQLGLGYNKLSDSGCKMVLSSQKLKSMKRLALPGNNATVACTAALRSCSYLKQLELLNLHGNQLTDKTAQAIVEAKPKQLELLLLSENKLTTKGVAAIQKAFPNTRLKLNTQR